LAFEIVISLDTRYSRTQFTCFTGTKWYKSTNTGAAVELLALLHASLGEGTQFTCFTGTKVPILTSLDAKVQILTSLDSSQFGGGGGGGGGSEVVAWCLRLCAKDEASRTNWVRVEALLRLF
jgi:hypothetical protein